MAIPLLAAHLRRLQVVTPWLAVCLRLPVAIPWLAACPGWRSHGRRYAPDLLSAIGGGMPPEGGEDPMAAAPGSEDVQGSPEDMVTRGQADVVMDIVERTLASTGKGKTKTQQEAEFDLEQQKSTQEMEQEAAMGPDALPGGGGPMGGMGGEMDPGMFAGPLSGTGADKSAEQAMQAGQGMVADAVAGLGG